MTGVCALFMIQTQVLDSTCIRSRVLLFHLLHVSGLHYLKNKFLTDPTGTKKSLILLIQERCTLGGRQPCWLVCFLVSELDVHVGVWYFSGVSHPQWSSQLIFSFIHRFAYLVVQRKKDLPLKNHLFCSLSAFVINKILIKRWNEPGVRGWQRRSDSW